MKSLRGWEWLARNRTSKEVKAFGEGGVGGRSAELGAPLYLEGSRITRDERNLITSTGHLWRYVMP